MAIDRSGKCHYRIFKSGIGLFVDIDALIHRVFESQVPGNLFVLGRIALVVGGLLSISDARNHHRFVRVELSKFVDDVENQRADRHGWLPPVCDMVTLVHNLVFRPKVHMVDLCHEEDLWRLSGKIFRQLQAQLKNSLRVGCLGRAFDHRAQVAWLSLHRLD